MANSDDSTRSGDSLTLKIMEALAEADARQLHVVGLRLNEALIAMTGQGLAPPNFTGEPDCHSH